MIKSSLSLKFQLFLAFVLLSTSGLVYSKTLKDAQSCQNKDNCPYLFEIVEGDTTFKKAIKEFMKLPEVANDSWIPEGTTSPSLPVTFNNSLYIMFTTCEPHNCGDNGYVLAYQLKKNKLIGLHINLNGNNTPVNSPSKDEVTMMMAFHEGELGEPGEQLPIKYAKNSNSPQKSDTPSESDKDKIIREVVQHCEASMGQYGPSIVKGCVDNDLDALQQLGAFLQQADEQQKKIIANCTITMKDHGWSIVKGCIENDLEAQAALDKLKN